MTHLTTVIGLLILATQYALSQERPTTLPELVDCQRLAEISLDQVAISEIEAVSTIERWVYEPEPNVGSIPLPHCRVVGTIDSSIGFELLLPVAWNGKFIMGGGGGYVGAITNQAQAGMSAGPTPLERGYATVGTDTGHRASPIVAEWALNDPSAKKNFADRAVHRTVEISKSIITGFYDREIDYSYFLGCSRGGGQAMISAQRYPADFDGVIAGSPAIDWTGVAAKFIRIQQLMYPDPSKLQSPTVTPANRRLLADALRESCDANDGIADGIINDPRSCTFDLAQLPRCQYKSADNCVTDEQLAAIEAIYTSLNIAGEQVYPEFPFGGEDVPGNWDMWMTRAEPPWVPPGIPNLQFPYGNEFFKYFIFNDPNWNYIGYKFEHWNEVSADAAALLNSTDPDLSAFRDRSGKIIMWHGWSDAGISALDSIEYYESVQKHDQTLPEYFRLFMMPGVSHCEGGSGPDYADWISALESWVEKDSPPESILASKIGDDGSVLIERPLCPYPQVAKYNGTGDPNLASSFRCDDSDE